MIIIGYDFHTRYQHIAVAGDRAKVFHQRPLLPCQSFPQMIRSTLVLRIRRRRVRRFFFALRPAFTPTRSGRSPRSLRQIFFLNFQLSTFDPQPPQGPLPQLFLFELLTPALSTPSRSIRMISKIYIDRRTTFCYTFLCI
jgi:hypothetical protein